ncbi:hypothetical protein RB195_025176 [Necator americanus]|uniref:Reverse transcriptase domain-containing protein n=1 Tax=Necator americanus TaxID=51031 RepID=A0ABR1ER64_NECAM
MQLAFLDFEAAFDSSHRSRFLNALRTDGVPGKFVCLLGDMNQPIPVAVRTPAGCTTPFGFGNWSKTTGSGRLPVHVRHRWHHAKNIQSLPCRQRLSTMSLDRS